MPALFLPALDLSALTGVLLLIGMLSVTAWTFERLADILDFSVLGIHPLRNVASAIRNTIIAGCNAGIAALQHIARDLWHGITWAIGEFISGVKTLAAHTDQALSLLWGTSIPKYVSGALRPIATSIAKAEAAIEDLARSVGRDVPRLDAKIESTAKATLSTAERDIQSAVNHAVNGINDELRVLRSTVDQAIQHALDLARTESGKAIGQLQGIEDAAIGAIDEAQNFTERELGDLLGHIDQTNLFGIAASVPILAQLVQTIARESGLESAECRGKVKQVCGTDPLDWTNLLAGATAFGAGIGLTEIIAAGREVIQYVADGAADFA